MERIRMDEMVPIFVHHEMSSHFSEKGIQIRDELTEAEAGHRAGDEARTARTWKLFVLLPPPPPSLLSEWGKIPKGKLSEQFTDFSRGQWFQMLITRILVIRR